MKEKKSSPLSTTNRIGKDYINSLPIIRFQGRVVLVDTSRDLKRACRKLRRAKEVGFDTESRPSFRPGTSYPISLVQLATPKTAYLIRIRELEDPRPLLDLFQDCSVKKIGVDTRGDIEKLQGDYRVRTCNFIDLAILAKKKGIIQFGAKNLSARYLGQRISKACQTSNWSRRELTEKQIRYAATDAWICLKIYPLLVKDSTNYKKLSDSTDTA